MIWNLIVKISLILQSITNVLINILRTEDYFVLDQHFVSGK